MRMSRLEVQARVRELREELEARHKFGTVKLAKNDGTPIPTTDLQEELFKLIYRLSKMDAEET